MPVIELSNSVEAWLPAVVLYDRTTGEDWLWSKKSERYNLPIDFPLGNRIAASGTGANIGEEQINVRLTIELINPYGTVVVSDVVKYYKVNPDVSFSCATDSVVANIEGMWKIHGVLEAALPGMPLSIVDELTVQAGLVSKTPTPPPPPPPTYECPYCNATFSTQAELDQHIEYFHPPSPPPPTYECPYCSATFNTEYALALHIENAHPPSPPPPPSFECPYCGATFDTESGLAQHIVDEHPELPPSPPPIEVGFPWIVVGIGAAVIVGIVAIKKF